MRKDAQTPGQKSIIRAWEWHEEVLPTLTGPDSLVFQHGSSQLEEEIAADVA